MIGSIAQSSSGIFYQDFEKRSRLKCNSITKFILNW
jgi:hypothetical protein